MNKNNIKKIFSVWDKAIITKPNSNDLQKLNIDDLMASIFCPGPFYWYVIDFSQRKMDYVHPNVKSVLGVEPEEFTLEYIINIVHPDDIEYMSKYEEMVVKFMSNNITTEDLFNYKMSYKFRAQHADGSYKHLFHQAITLTTDRENRVLQVLGIHCEISHISTTMERSVSFIGINGRPSFYGVTPNENLSSLHNTKTLFSKREIEIIQMASEGNGTKEIADNLNVSKLTIDTHRKNILKKSGSKNMSQVIVTALRKGLL